MSFIQRFTIHPVGQGLFYTCVIHHEGAVKFRMVFDCGSNTAGAGQEEVSVYRDPDYETKKILDLLVISHFDADHVKFIGKLLEGDIKVKKLVMPIITFEERLFLIARAFHDMNGIPDDDDQFGFRFILDPLGTINDHLDGGSEIYFIESNPNTPIPPAKEFIEESGSSDDQRRFVFEFDSLAKERMDPVELSISNPSSGGVFKVQDTNKGKLKSTIGVSKLMEFLFYRRSIGEKEKEFFRMVEKLFNKKFSIRESLPKPQRLQITKDAIRGIRNATAIKEIYRKAAISSGFVSKKGVKICDPNTTALCMLHRNLDGIFDFLGIDIAREPNYIRRTDRELVQIQKSGSLLPRREYPWWRFYPFYYYDEWRVNSIFHYPNVLLTSDTFLLSKEQVEELLVKYQHYWNDFWLFQVPHHGSENNGDKLLFANIPVYCYNFINYGVGNRDEHPKHAVISDLVATGHSAKLIAVNQFSGLRFDFIVGR